MMIIDDCFLNAHLLCNFRRRLTTPTPLEYATAVSYHVEVLIATAA